MTKTEKAVKTLAKHFRRWGRAATRRVFDMTKKHGVCFIYFASPRSTEG